MAQEKVVLTGQKVDFHIHSHASSHKDDSKVKDGTLKNISVLIEGLKNKKVNMCAISDHDAFDKELYLKLKEEECADNCIRKVLPAVEFSVLFPSDNEEDSQVHIVAIFDDTEDEIENRIVSAIPCISGKPKYDGKSAFSETKFWEIIRSINSNVVLIAHQKNSLTSQNVRHADANSVGEQGFDRFLFLEYFDVFEYKNRKNELFNKNYIYEKDIEDKLRFITGSDCHQWSVYPHYDEHKQDEMPYTYLKCLPTFKGLAMAVTDFGRIKTVNSFFSPAPESKDSIELQLNESSISIPLSPGINVIIGDNSIGKSLLISKLTQYHGIKKQLSDGYEKYLKDNGIVVETVIPEGNFKIDHQGVIRDRFENLGQGLISEELQGKFPEAVDVGNYREIAQRYLDAYVQAVRCSVDYQKQLAALCDFSIPPFCEQAEVTGLKIIGRASAVSSTKETSFVSKLKKAVNIVEGFKDSFAKQLDEEDIEDIASVERILNKIIKKHQGQVSALKRDESIANAINTVLDAKKKSFTDRSTDRGKLETRFLSDKNSFAEGVASIIKKRTLVKEVKFSFDPVTIKPDTKNVGAYVFVSRTASREISPRFLEDIVSKVLRAGKHIDTSTVDASTLKKCLLQYHDEDGDPILVLENKLNSLLDDALKPQQAIINQGDDLFMTRSQGYNAQIYFALLADGLEGSSIYLIDQPEDQISQTAIKSAVIKDFRNIAQSRQVILVTHNPQFIVNLDADNVILIKRDDEGKISISSGALEYECDDYKMLGLVAENVEGGLDTIKKRMKRYEKAD